MKVARMARTAAWRRRRREFIGVIMAGSLSSAIEVDAGVGQGPVRLDEEPSLSLNLKPEWKDP